jgi:phosphohistidine phosphatase
MLNLILLRHAKSSWSDRKRDDFDRPLSSRGREAAPAIGRALAKRGYLPERVLCSPARRTRETLKLVLDAMRINPPVAYDDRLYAFDDGTAYLNFIVQQQNAASLMLIGHNPSTQALALRLAVSGDVSGLERMRRKFPTAAVAVIAFSFDDWSRLSNEGDRNGQLQLFLTPKMLDE